MRGAGEIFWSFQSALDECLVDDYLGGNVGQLTSLPRLYLLSHGFEVSLHPIHTDSNAVDQRKRLRMFSKHRRKVSGERHVRADEDAIAAGHRQTHALVMGITQADGEAASFHLSCEVENPKGFHAARRDCVLVVHDSDV